MENIIIFLYENKIIGIALLSAIIIIIPFILLMTFYIFNFKKTNRYLKKFSPCVYHCIKKPVLEKHKLFQKFDQWNDIDIKNLKINNQLKLLLEIKFKTWEEEYSLIAKNKNLESYSNKELHKYTIDRINKTTAFCRKELKEKNIDKDIVTKFIKRHDARATLLTSKLNYIIHDNYYYPSNNLKMAVFFSTSILTFDLAISHAIEIDKEIKEKLIA